MERPWNEAYEFVKHLAVASFLIQVVFNVSVCAEQSLNLQSSGVPAAIQVSIDDGLPDRLMSLDPREDGWVSEHFNGLAGARLAALGEKLTAPSRASSQELAGLASDEFSCAALRPSHLERVFDDGTVRVERNPTWNDGPSYQGAAGLADALIQLLHPLQNARQLRAKFKVIRVHPHDEAARVDTVQLVELSGVNQSELVELHATWRIEWEWAGGDSLPRMRSITAEDFEQSSVTNGGSPLFVDCTRAAFAAEQKIFQDHIMIGIDRWIRELENYRHVLQFGHNGLAIGDVNGDGLDDLYSCQTGGLPNRLLLGQPDGTVRDISAWAGVDFLDNTRAALLLDLDNDDDQDLVVSLPQAILLMKNDGRGKFSMGARVADVYHAFSLAAADYDEDGDLDIYACVYYPPNETASELPIPMPLYDANNGGRNLLLRNDSAWLFSDVTQETGLDENNTRFSYAVVWEDFDNDGDQDLFVANDFGRCNLYRNEAGRFRDVTNEAGMVDGAFGMSASVSDYNRDGWIDYYKANMFSSAGNRITYQPQFMPGATANHKERFRQLARGNSLFENRGGTFRDASAETGVSMGRWSWGSLFADFNNDGWDDLLVVNGFVTGPQTDDL